MRCRDVQQFTSALVDGELDAPTAVEIEKHIASCSACRTRAESERLLKRELQRRLGTIEAPSGLRARVHAALVTAAAEEAASRSAQVTPPVAVVPTDAVAALTTAGASPTPAAATWAKWRAAVPVAMAAGLALFFVAPRAWLSIGPSAGSRPTTEQASMLGGPLVLSDVVGRHVRSLPPEVSGTPERVGNWFHGKVDFPVHPPVFREEAANLVGARISWVRDQPAAHLFYDIGGRRVSVIVFAPGRRFPVDGIAGLCFPKRKVWVGRSHGINVALLERDRMAYALASDLSEPQVLGLASGL